MQRFAIFLLAAFLAGCSSFRIPGYQSQHANLSMLQGGGKPVQVIMEEPLFDDDGSIFCRVTGPVTLPDGQTFSVYITTALRDELDSATLLTDTGNNKINVTVKRVNFCSILGAANWYIDTDYLLNGQKISISTEYKGKSSFTGKNACKHMAQSFHKAVAEHLRQLYAHPEFTKIIGIYPGRPEALGVRDIGAYEFIGALESDPLTAIPAILLLLLSDDQLEAAEGYEPPEPGEFDGRINSYSGTFAEAFAAARKAGNRIFKWNGKIFHTRLAEEVGEQKPPEPGSFEEAFGNARKAGKGAGDTFEWNGKLYDAGIVGENASEVQSIKDKVKGQ